MNDHDLDLERLLRNHYRSLDPRVAPTGLAARIDSTLDRRSSRWPTFGRPPALATGLVAVAAAVALAFMLLPGRLTGPAAPTPSVTPAPTASPTATPSPSRSTAPSPSPTPALPGGTPPPVSTEPWRTLDLQPLPGGPAASSIVAWSGGYLALGDAGDGTAPALAWVSGDGRTWTQLPSDSFGNVISIAAAPDSGAVLVLATTLSRRGEAWRSADGVTWTPAAAPSQVRIDTGYVAGNASGVVVAVESQPARVERSTDGTSWQTVPMPRGDQAQVTGVAATGSGFVAVGDEFGVSHKPVAWWSTDGITWNVAQVSSRLAEKFVEVHAAATGLVAISKTVNVVPGGATYWTSTDGGRSWQTADDPLGVWQQGEGAGNPNGVFSGDGTRLLGYGVTADGQPTEYWVSIDATSWTKLTLTGDTAAADAGDVTPLLLRDGILFAAPDGAWFGQVAGS